MIHITLQQQQPKSAAACTDSMPKGVVTQDLCITALTFFNWSFTTSSFFFKAPSVHVCGINYFSLSFE